MKHLFHALPASIAAVSITLLLVGCATSPSSVSTPITPPSSPVSGHVLGGTQPISGATVQLYAVGTSGYASAAKPLLTSSVSTDTDGSFTISSDYVCTGNPLVYIVATQGHSSLTTSANPYLALTAALGPCSSLSSSNQILVNELTTVASAYALAPFMTDAAHVGTTISNETGITNAFAAVNELANISTGTTPGPSLPANATLPAAPISTIAGILSSCVNSAGGTQGDGGACDQLFSGTTVQGARPSDTVGAVLSMAKHPGHNVGLLWALTPGQSPFQPTLTAAPTDWTLAINHTGGGLNAAQGIAADANGNFWLPNKGNNSVTQLSPIGAALSPSTGYPGFSTPAALAIDTTGTVWIANQGAGAGSSSLVKMSPSGSILATYAGGGLNVPTSVAIDANGTIWLANSGANSISGFTSSGTPLSPTGFSGAGLNNAISVAINPK
jgi:hypothetical protein